MVIHLHYVHHTHAQVDHVDRNGSLATSGVRYKHWAGIGDLLKGLNMAQQKLWMKNIMQINKKIIICYSDFHR